MKNPKLQKGYNIFKSDVFSNTEVSSKNTSNNIYKNFLNGNKENQAVFSQSGNISKRFQTDGTEKGKFLLNYILFLLQICLKLI